MEAEKIRAAVNDIELVDGHAHNLVALESCHPFLSAFSEAHGPALSYVPHTLSFKLTSDIETSIFQRGLEDIANLYNLGASLESIQEFRQNSSLTALSIKCFKAAKISTVLLDDGLEFDGMKDLAWHKEVVGDVHRILRIEYLAENILKQGLPGVGDKWTLKKFEELFVAGLKSYPKFIFSLCLRPCSGLRINPSVTDEDAEKGLVRTVGTVEEIRLTDKNLTDWIFTKALELATSHDIPMQIHTGFGDVDLDLELANPVLLRSILEDLRFKHARIVLLHAAYPYMRQASYLACVYPQIHLDFGLAIPKLSVRGMKTAVAELLELAPINKVMFSTDAYAFPETYYLGAKWARTVLAEVLCDCVEEGDLSVDEAIAAAESILSKNSLAFYKLTTRAQTSDNSENQKAVDTNASKNFECSHSSLSVLDKVDYVRLLWGDTTGQRRCRVVPSARYKAVALKNGLSLATCCMALSSHKDAPARGSGLSGTGEIRLMPDASTLLEVPQWNHGLVLADMHVKPGTPSELCPRTTLRRLTGLLEEEYQLALTVVAHADDARRPERWEAVDSSSYCSSTGLTQSLATLECMLSWLNTMQINIEQFHAESGGGQFEFALAHEPILIAADKLLLAREAITAAALQQNFLATFIPKLNLKTTPVGSGSHVHLSLWKEGKNVFSAESKADSNFGIYERLKPNMWCGAFQCWGQVNREAPLRTSSPPDVSDGVVSNFELKSFDGCANPHLGLAAIVAGGLDGLRKKLKLPAPVDGNPADEVEGVIRKLPRTLEDAAQCLEEDDLLRQLMGEQLVKVVLAIRRADVAHYKSLSPDDLLYKY
ncbi:hypothetical protein AXG93_593s1080 [Marchantia polymorpha subsp. ruderalis]|uniref:GS catalytic domain-containing protein n=1 Tax=Marchantia polymorpha subsp. ruderalis TaxID=1480154 RepID=A0A176WRP3_MARPO|nr:hypothetical protein AXG93_593s1080 [Marchantia polymorpha subsp. ruderalis]